MTTRIFEKAQPWALVLDWSELTVEEQEDTRPMLRGDDPDGWAFLTHQGHVVSANQLTYIERGAPKFDKGSPMLQWEAYVQVSGTEFVVVKFDYDDMTYQSATMRIVW